MDKSKGRIAQGKVVSTPTLKTVIVEIHSTTRHPLYKKLIRRTKRVPAHNEKEGIVVGDLVRICETRPISRTKHFIVEEKV